MPPSPIDLPRVRWWRRRKNPLCRRTDIARAWLAAGLFVAVLAGTPVAAFLAGDAAHRHHQEAARQQAATRHHATAVLVHDAPRHPEPGSVEARKTLYPVPVRFTDTGGQARTGTADVPPDRSAGSTVPVWVGADGRLTRPPLTSSEIRDRTVGWAVLAALAVPAVGAGLHGLAAHRLRRRDLAAWDEAWARTAPLWTASP
ncbi:hypothetical protein [Streptomyces sp. L2]|uniref:Rv1733c family protein n=1 Tax=Streptomyces sp. L2 TaxID=2162665 RepID=UPI001F510367|nr:hypothetical protein [Streptomyces sp. L2]